MLVVGNDSSRFAELQLDPSVHVKVWCVQSLGFEETLV